MTDIEQVMAEYCSHDGLVIMDGVTVPLASVTINMINQAADIRTTEDRVIKSRHRLTDAEMQAALTAKLRSEQPDLELIADDIYASMTAMVSTGNLSVEQLMRLIWAATDNLIQRYDIDEVSIGIYAYGDPIAVEFVVTDKHENQYRLSDQHVKDPTKWSGNPPYFTKRTD